MTTNVYDLNMHVHQRGGRPAGAIRATVKTPFVIVTRPHPRTKVHRPAYAALATIDGRTVLAARFLCGSASTSVSPITEPPSQVLVCERCDQMHSGAADVFSVYAYYNARAEVLYVGQTINLTSRHKSHRRSSRWFTEAVHRATLSEHDTRAAALAAEAHAITTLRPLYNLRGVA